MKRVAIYAVALTVLLAFVAPLVWLAVISLKTRAQIYADPSTFLGFDPTLDNYRSLLTGRFPVFIGNSLVAAMASTALALAIGLPAAYALVGRRLRAGGLVRSGVLLFRMIPPIALLLPYYLLFRTAGLLGSLAAVSVAHFAFSIAIVTWMTRAGFEAVPGEIEEAARIDGASPLRVFLLIAIPITRAPIAASAIFALLTSWNEFLFAATLSSPRTQTIPVAVAGFAGDVYVSWGELAAATVIGLVPALGLAALGQRWLLSGMAPGAFK